MPKKNANFPVCFKLFYPILSHEPTLSPSWLSPNPGHESSSTSTHIFPWNLTELASWAWTEAAKIPEQAVSQLEKLRIM